jgi:hypothetical protein
MLSLFIICLMPFFIKFGSMGDIRFSQFFLLIALAVTTTLGTSGNDLSKTKDISKRKVILSIIAIALIAFLNTSDIYKGLVLSRIIGFSLGLIIFFNLIGIKSLSKTWYVMAFLCITQSAWIFLQYFGVNLHHMMAPENFQVLSNINQKWTILPQQVISGSLGHPNLSSAMIAITIPSLFRQGYWKYAGLSVIALLLTKSSFGVGTLVITSAFWFFGTKGVLWGLFSAIGVFIYGHFYGGFFSNNNRMDVWIDGVTLFFRQDFISVIFGNGLGWFPAAFNKAFTYDSVYNHAHNEYLEVLFAFGIVGLILMVFVFTSFLRMNAPKYLKACFLAISFNCLANFPFHVGSLAATSILVAATIFSNRKESDDGIFSFKTKRAITRRSESTSL